MEKIYDYVIIGSGIAGSCVAFELQKYSKSILIIDEKDKIAAGASKAAGAFLSPLLGKPNTLKSLITKALVYSTSFYKKNTPQYINNCGTIRIPKNKEDELKFEEYKEFMDFDFEEKKDGYFFKIGSVVDAQNTCMELTKNVEKKLNYKVNHIDKTNNIWFINNEIQAKSIIITTGANTNLYSEDYFKIRPVWGQRIDIKTTTKVDVNFHKACSVSVSSPIDDVFNKVSIGATHQRIDPKALESFHFKLEKIQIDVNNNELLSHANDIIDLESVEILEMFEGARANSIDYLPMVGKLIDSKKTIEEFPYLKNGTHVNEKRFTRYNNLFVLNGIGGRGFVLSPYLANMLVENIINNKDIDPTIQTTRLFERWVKKL
jgi:tRNA 5-methylaminomethyl-2-thiouridine biosynthesis bifunctional protein